MDAFVTTCFNLFRALRTKLFVKVKCKKIQQINIISRFKITKIFVSFRNVEI